MWTLTDKDLKSYPHLDGHMTVAEAEALANDPEAVAKHAFFPFILFNKSWRKFAKQGKKRKRKIRPIRYAARADAYIFTRYRALLAEAYERELAKRSLDNNVLAYRRVKDPKTGKGKSNIEFARDAFDAVVSLENCFCISLDISAFFESLDHERLKKIWQDFLDVDRLPPDHFAVFKAITSYSVVEKQALYQRLGFFGAKPAPGPNPNNKMVMGYTTPFKEIPIKLCSGKDFRLHVAGGDGQKSIIDKNKKPYGIPQGAPISDLLANAYLLEFDSFAKETVDKVGGFYFRYSDDILLVVPTEGVDPLAIEQEIRISIGKFGSKILIKEEKSSILEYFRIDAERQKFKRTKGLSFKNGLEYLGFRYDGTKIFLRDSTLANLYRKTIRTARRQARKHVETNPTLDEAQLLEAFNYEAFYKRFGRVEKFEEFESEKRSWTFWTYFQRILKVLPKRSEAIKRQMRKYRSNNKLIVRRQIARAYAKKQREKAVATST